MMSLDLSMGYHRDIPWYILEYIDRDIHTDIHGKIHMDIDRDMRKDTHEESVRLRRDVLVKKYPW